MTLHVTYDHQCPSCGAFYIPYDENIACPSCGIIETERFDYIPQAVSSLLFNKSSVGSFTPAAWWVGTLGDHILSILFSLLDAFEEGEQQEFSTFSKEYLAKLNWGDQEYLREHIHNISVRVKEDIDNKTEEEFRDA